MTFVFPTPIHTFAQAFLQISIDAPNHFYYRPRQIEPGSLELYGSVSRALQPNGGCAARLNQEAEKFYGFSSIGRNNLNRWLRPYFFPLTSGHGFQPCRSALRTHSVIPSPPA